MDYTALRSEILTDPAGLGYAPFVEAGSHNQVAGLLNVPRYPSPGKVDVATALIWIAKHGLMARLRAAAQGDNAQVASIAEVALLLVQAIVPPSMGIPPHLDLSMVCNPSRILALLLPLE